MPVPTVFATAVPKVNAATKLKNAAQTTALPGDSTRVDTTVAIELAASWKPLMKSKTSATTMSADDDPEASRGYPCLTMTPSSTLATSSQRSVASSRKSRSPSTS